MAMGLAQDPSFNQVKTKITKPMVLYSYSPEARTKISADAYSHRLGAVLMQEEDSHWKHVAFATRAMTETECHYMHIEKEALATTWACDKFSTYILGCSITIETDHKSLVPLLSYKNPSNSQILPCMARYTYIQGLIQHCPCPWKATLHSRYPLQSSPNTHTARAWYSIVHVPGKLLCTADTFSRAPLSTSTSKITPQDSPEHFIHTVISSLPAFESRLKTYREAKRITPDLVFFHCPASLASHSSAVSVAHSSAVLALSCFLS